MNQSTQTAVREASHIKALTITAVFIALTYVFTAFVNIRLPIAANGGLIHLGNVPLFIGAMIFGKRTGGYCRRHRDGDVRPAVRMDCMGFVYPGDRRPDGIHCRSDR